MSAAFHISKQDSADLGFALAAYRARAIDIAEFRGWIYHVVEHVDDVPGHMFDLLDETEQTIPKLDWRTIGFEPASGLGTRQMDALEGVGFLREKAPTPHHPDERDMTMTALRADPEMRTRFARAFPFLQLPEQA